MSKLRNLVVSAGALLAAGAVAAHAQSLPVPNQGGVSGGQLEIAGVAPGGCIIAAPRQQFVANASLTGTTATNAQVSILQLVDPNTAVPQASTISLAFPVACNTAHVVTLTTRSNGLQLQTVAPPPGPGFRNHLDYQMSVGWGGQRATQLSGTATPVRVASPNAAAGELSVTVQIEGGGMPLEAGVYSDSLILSLQPAS